MAARKTNWERRHLEDVAAYVRKIEGLYRSATSEAVRLCAAANIDTSVPLVFDDYPSVRRRVDSLVDGLHDDTLSVIVNGVRSQWTLANAKDDELCNVVFGDNVKKLTQEQYRRYYSDNGEALEAFLKRKEDGLGLSDRVWNYTKQFRGEIELGIDVGLRNGLSADEMSADLRQYLKYPDKLFRRVRDERGVLRLSQAAAAFHPGRGVYRSSYKNARRLAATETNIAYRTADYERWQQLDFVVGQRIEVSKTNHPVADICDTLAGDYPKNFQFTGWHPQCRCHATSILKTDNEIEADTKRILAGKPTDGESANSIDFVPEKFNQWVADNKERAKGWSSMPYFVRENPQYISGFEVDTYTKIERKFTSARKTNNAMEESLGIFLRAKYPELPNTEKAAIFYYTQGDRAAFRLLNNQLRKDNLSEFNEAFSGLLSQGISKLATTNKITYRSVRLNKTILREYVDLANRTSTTTFKGFTSASLDREIAVDFGNRHVGRKHNETDILLVIKGKSGHPIEDLSQFGGRFAGKANQREVLFDKGLKFRFDKIEIENGVPVFYITEI